jgi:hypothetical protein
MASSRRDRARKNVGLSLGQSLTDTNAVRSIKRSPLSIVLSLFLIVTSAIVIGGILPGIVAYRAGVFTEEMMRSILPDDAKSEMTKFKDAQVELRAKVTRIDEALSDISPGGITGVRLMKMGDLETADLAVACGRR